MQFAHSGFAELAVVVSPFCPQILPKGIDASKQKRTGTMKSFFRSMILTLQNRIAKYRAESAMYKSPVHVTIELMAQRGDVSRLANRAVFGN